MTSLMRDSACSETSFAKGSILGSKARYASEDGPSALLAYRAKPDWVRERCSRLESFRNLPPNWDSYGALKPVPTSIEIAKLLLNSLGEIIGVERPDVSLSPSGNAALSWEFANGRLNLDIEVLATGAIRFSFVDEEDESMARDGVTEDANDIATILTQWEARSNESGGAHR